MISIPTRSVPIKEYVTVRLELANVFLVMKEWLVNEQSVQIIVMIVGPAGLRNIWPRRLDEHTQHLGMR